MILKPLYTPHAIEDQTRGEVMKTVLKGALAGIAIGGLTSAVVEINKSVMQTLWRFNCLAAETAWVMAKSSVEWITQTEDEDEDETNES